MHVEGERNPGICGHTLCGGAIWLTDHREQGETKNSDDVIGGKERGDLDECLY